MISDITNKLIDAQSTIKVRFILSLYIRYEHKLYRYIDAVAVTIILRLFSPYSRGPSCYKTYPDNLKE